MRLKTNQYALVINKKNIFIFLIIFTEYSLKKSEIMPNSDFKNTIQYTQ